MKLAPKVCSVFVVAVRNAECASPSGGGGGVQNGAGGLTERNTEGNDILNRLSKTRLTPRVQADEVEGLVASFLPVYEHTKNLLKKASGFPPFPQTEEAQTEEAKAAKKAQTEEAQKARKTWAENLLGVTFGPERFESELRGGVAHEVFTLRTKDKNDESKKLLDALLSESKEPKQLKTDFYDKWIKRDISGTILKIECNPDDGKLRKIEIQWEYGNTPTGTGDLKISIDVQEPSRISGAFSSLTWSERILRQGWSSGSKSEGEKIA